MNVPSTYLSHIDGFSDVDPDAISSKYSMYKFANTGDNGVVEITIKMKTIVRKTLMIKINKLRFRNLDNCIFFVFFAFFVIITIFV